MTPDTSAASGTPADVPTMPTVADSAQWRFNPPPGWPADFDPRTGQHNPAWSPAPTGWQWWTLTVEASQRPRFFKRPIWTDWLVYVGLTLTTVMAWRSAAAAYGGNPGGPTFVIDFAMYLVAHSLAGFWLPLGIRAWIRGRRARRS